MDARFGRSIAEVIGRVVFEKGAHPVRLIFRTRARRSWCSLKLSEEA